MPQSKRYLDYFKTIESDRWHKVKDYVPANPQAFIDYLEQLPFAGRAIDKENNEFKIIGKL